MKYKNKELRKMAREALEGKFPVLIAAQMVLFLGEFLADMLLSSVFRGEGIMIRVTYGVSQFIFLLLMTVFEAGLYVMVLHISRGEDYSYKDLLYFLKKEPDRVIIAGFFLTAITTVISIPSNLLLLKMPESIYTNQNEALKWLTLFLIAMLATEALRIICMLPFVLTYWFLCDYDSVSGWDAIKESFFLMKGKKRRYFCLLLGFIPYIVLSVFTFGIGMLWVNIYIKMTEAFFYREVTGEALPWHGRECSYKKDSSKEETNDYNAEA